VLGAGLGLAALLLYLEAVYRQHHRRDVHDRVRLDLHDHQFLDSAWSSPSA
jgi:hypothetical protein